MKKDIGRHQYPRAVRPALLVVSALVTAAALGGTSAAAAGHGSASAHKAGKASHQRRLAGLESPQLERGALAIVGTNRDDRLALRLQAGNRAIVQLDVGDDGSADFEFARAEIRTLSVAGGNGDDAVRIDESNGVFTDTIPATIDGGNGDDSLAGGSGAETLVGGNGNDSIDGNKGSDVAYLGNGADTFVWDPGDGSDVVEGQNGVDTMLFNGADASETVDVSANGSRLRFFRNPGNVVMDTNGVEKVDFNALGGADLVTVDDLSGTDVREVNVDLAATGGVGDRQPDRVVVNATKANDRIDVSGDSGAVKVSGLSATVQVLHPEAVNDRLEINTVAGTDVVDAGDLAAGAIQLFVDGDLVP